MHHRLGIKLAKHAVLGLGMLLTQGSTAQSTDGYHAIQVFPVVVDTASFAQRFHFRAVYPWDATAVTATYYPAQGTLQPAPLACSGFDLQPHQSLQFASLRALCPGLVAGSAFGTLVVRSTSGQPFAAASRISNPAGNGFFVEGFPASDFTSAELVVTGLRRRASTAQSPAFQTNCFIGNLAELAPAGAPRTTTVEMAITTPAGAVLGQKSVAVQPGQLVRLLDVFAEAGIAAGDVEDAVASFRTPLELDRGGILAFCTVQDNSSFGADFRIGKQELGWDVVPGAQDESARRTTWTVTEDLVDEGVPATTLSLPAGATRSVHLFYFRHPDVIGCKLRDGAGESIFPAYGLEMRLRVHDVQGGWRVLAGGNDATEFAGLYLGDKNRQGDGANTAYLLEVESNGRNEGVPRTYMIVCNSGSGHTHGERLRAGLPVTF